MDWEEEERAQPGPWRELARLGARAARRWALTLALALGVSAAVAAIVAHVPSAYQSRVVFRISEGAIDAESQLHTNGRLREYVSSVVFSTTRLKQVIAAEGLYPSVWKRDPNLAVEQMRDDLEVEVWRNYFGEARSPSDPARSAWLAVRYSGRDRERVFAVVQHLAMLIRDHEANRRMEVAEAGLFIAEEEARSAHALFARRKREIVEKELERKTTLVAALGLKLLVQQRDLEQALPRIELTVQKADKARERAYLRLQLERRALGMRWELVDPGRVEPKGLSLKLRMTLGTLLLFFLSLPLAVIVVGAFDSRIYNADDVLRLGFSSVGVVRGFSGDNVGALVERLRVRMKPS
jgi:hypothetical protein